MLQEELKSVKDALEQLQDILQQKKDQAAISTQTEVEDESKVISVKQKDQGTQAKNVGVDASSSTDQKETREMEVQTDVEMSDLRDLYDKEGKYVRTELSDPKSTPAEVPEKSTLSKG